MDFGCSKLSPKKLSQPWYQEQTTKLSPFNQLVPLRQYICGESYVRTQLPSTSQTSKNDQGRTIKMISDDDLYQLAIFLGSAAMLLIVLYHFLEVNGDESAVSNLDQKPEAAAEGSSRSGKQDAATVAGTGDATTSGGGSSRKG